MERVTPNWFRRVLTSARTHHAAIAIAVAAVAAAISLLRPLDIAVWSIQAQLFSHEPSGDIVYVSDEGGAEAETAAERNARLASLLDSLAEQGAGQVVLTQPVTRSRSLLSDIKLRESIRTLGDRLVLTHTVREDFGADMYLRPNDVFFSHGIRSVSSDMQDDFMQFVWVIEPSYERLGTSDPALWTALSPGAESAPVFVDYSIDWKQIPTSDVRSLVASSTDANIRGKTFVVGSLAGEGIQAKIPGYGPVPAPLIHILAAETSIRGSGHLISGITMVAAFGAVLLAGLHLLPAGRRRRIFYACWVASFGFVIVLSAEFGLRVEIVDAFLIPLVFGFLRAKANFKRRHFYTDEKSRLPNFMALRRDLGDEGARDDYAMVIAKITRLEAIFASLVPAEQKRYLRQVASRLSLGDENTAVYYDGGKYFGFVLPLARYDDLEAHLDGLRAVVSQAILLSDRPVDVSLTIGVDCSLDKPLHARISSAIAAADQAREAYRPVFIITDFEADSEQWDYSLQARLETALSEDRISIKLQPKAELETGRIVGAEALARWVDQEKGEISPAQFVPQCERAGRLDDLTRRVMLRSMQASHDLAVRELPSQVSINVSAVQLVDNRIVEIVHRALNESSVNPCDITIEITETARIEDFDRAGAIMLQLAEEGIRFSIDDFGVASANLDALFRLPFNELKLDQMFVREIGRSNLAGSIVANTISLARDAGLSTVAEGIEDESTFVSLRNLGCDYGQGYYLGRPQTIPLFRETLILQGDMEDRQRSFG